MKFFATDVANSLQKPSSKKPEVHQKFYTKMVGMKIPAIISREHYYLKSCRFILIKNPSEKKGTQ